MGYEEVMGECINDLNVPQCACLTLLTNCLISCNKLSHALSRQQHAIVMLLLRKAM